MFKSLNAYQCVIFDWDGTLMDSVGNIVQAVRYAAEVVELPIPSAKAVRRGIGRSFDYQYMHLFMDCQPQSVCDHADVCKSDFQKTFYQYYHQLPACLFDDVITVLKRLSEQGVTLAIATSGTRSMLDSMTKSFGLGAYFAVTCCGDEFRAKPEPDMLLHILSVLDVSSEHAVMVGDSVNDVYAAKHAFIDAVCVETGVECKESLLQSGALCVADSLKALLS